MPNDICVVFYLFQRSQNHIQAILKPEKAIIAPKVWQVIAFAYAKEESPSCNKTEFHLTDGWGDPRDSVTESKLPLRR